MKKWTTKLDDAWLSLTDDIHFDELKVPVETAFWLGFPSVMLAFLLFVIRKYFVKMKIGNVMKYIQYFSPIFALPDLFILVRFLCHPKGYSIFLQLVLVF